METRGVLVEGDPKESDTHVVTFDTSWFWKSAWLRDYGHLLYRKIEKKLPVNWKEEGF